MRFMLDANVDEAVGTFLESRDHRVNFVNRSFLPGTPDSEIDAVARIDGWIIVSHDQRFLRKIQQPRFAFSDPAHSGYGRVMLMTRLSQQATRVRQCLDIIEMVYAHAMATGRRLLITVGPAFVRYDDQPAPSTLSSRALPAPPVEQ